MGHSDRTDHRRRAPGEHPWGGSATAVRVPQKLLRSPSPNCYKFHPEKPVTQCSPLPADNGHLVTQASGMTRYPPLFYVVEGAVLRATTAADLSGSRVLYSARLAAAVLTWLTVGFGVFLLSRRFSARAALLAALLGFPATAWFLGAPVNPNGLEAAAAFLLAAGVLSMRVDHILGARSVAAILAVPLGTLLLAWSRPLSWVWASLILLLLLVPTGRVQDESWTRRLPIRRLGAIAGAATVVILASSVVWFGYALQIRSSELAPLVSPAAWLQLGLVRRVNPSGG